jgi:hypothetical protein
MKSKPKFKLLSNWRSRSANQKSGNPTIKIGSVRNEDFSHNLLAGLPDMGVLILGNVQMTKIRIAEWLALIATISIIAHGITRYSSGTVNTLAEIAKQLLME